MDRTDIRQFPVFRPGTVVVIKSLNILAIVSQEAIAGTESFKIFGGIHLDHKTSFYPSLVGSCSDIRRKQIQMKS